MTTADEFLADLASFIGYHESPAGSNQNQFSKALGRPAEAWCADFLIARARVRGVVLPSESAYTPALFKAFRDAHQTSAVPVRGAFAFFDFPEGDPVDHVGCVESWTSTTITTIDGNTSVSGSQSNGGAVARRTRNRSLVAGYGLPRYGSGTASGIKQVSTIEVDMQITNYDVTISTDGNGNGWQKIPHPVDRIVGFLSPGIRPGADHAYVAAEIGFAPEDPGTVVSVTDWSPNTSCVIRIRVAA